MIDCGGAAVAVAAECVGGPDEGAQHDCQDEVDAWRRRLRSRGPKVAAQVRIGRIVTSARPMRPPPIVNMPGAIGHLLAQLQ